MSTRMASLTAIAAVATAIAAAPALAATNGGGGGGSGGATDIECREGWEYNPEKKVCEPEQEAHLLDDGELYEYGNALALAGHYEEALGALEAIGDKNDAMILTMIGYSKRKLGAIDEGIAYYHQALAIEPDNLNTHEYLGEGYLSAGRFDLAEAELNTLERLCGTDCEQYRDLAAVMAGAPGWN